MSDFENKEQRSSTKSSQIDRSRQFVARMLLILGLGLLVGAAVPPATQPETPPETLPETLPGFPPGAPPTTQPNSPPGRLPDSLPSIPTAGDLFVRGVEKAHRKKIWDTKHALRFKILATNEGQEYLNATLLYDLRTGRVLFVERLRRRALPSQRIDCTPRVGVDYAGAWADRPLRFLIKGNAHVSCRV